MHRRAETAGRRAAHVNLLIIDEAARAPDELYRAVRPMLVPAAASRFDPCRD
jgi:hypothetical protein